MVRGGGTVGRVVDFIAIAITYAMMRGGKAAEGFRLLWQEMFLTNAGLGEGCGGVSETANSHFVR